MIRRNELKLIFLSQFFSRTFLCLSVFFFLLCQLEAIKLHFYLNTNRFHVFCLFYFSPVKKRIDRTQSRLDKLSNQELLLESAHALRIEKERQKELESQLEQQTQAIQRANTVKIRLKINENRIDQ